MGVVKWVELNTVLVSAVLLLVTSVVEWCVDSKIENKYQLMLDGIYMYEKNTNDYTEMNAY